MAVYLYVMGRASGPVKIGISQSPFGRIMEVRTGCPFQIEILYMVPMLKRSDAMKRETAAHATFARRRMAGEWFDITADRAINHIGAQTDDWESKIDWAAPL